MSGGRRRAVAGLLAACVTLRVVSAASGEIRVAPLVEAGRVFASFNAASTFSADAKAVLQSGLLLTFTFAVDLRRPSTLWWDRTLGTVTVASSVKFDNLTGVYQVSKLLDGHVTWSQQTQDADKVREWMTTFDRVSIVVAEALEANADYYVRVRMQASPKPSFSLPWPLGHDDGAGRSPIFTFIR